MAHEEEEMKVLRIAYTYIEYITIIDFSITAIFGWSHVKTEIVFEDDNIHY